MADAADYGELLRQLREDIAYRRLDSGMQCLEANRSLIGSLAPTRKSAGVLLGYLAQWVDIGFEGPQLIKSLLPRFPKDSRAALPLLDRKSTRLNSSHLGISYAVFCLKKQK